MKIERVEVKTVEVDRLEVERVKLRGWQERVKVERMAVGLFLAFSLCQTTVNPRMLF